MTNKPKVEAPVEDPRITQMLASTQQVTFIDSIVVSKADFMRHIPLSPSSGRVEQIGGLGTFTSEMGDRRLTTTRRHAADTATVIMSSDFIADKWSEPQPLGGIGSEAANNPFLMPDGITLYFAQKGEKSIGGYDIFVTRYDSDRGTFLKPDNLGMPFASEGNDYFYAIDEFNQLGYFVTDRRQPMGMVCIYVFIPSETRRVYPSEAYSDAQLRSLAAINRIADTWGNEAERRDALARLQTAKQAQQASASQQTGTQSSELEQMKRQADTMEQDLNRTRRRYAAASPEEQRSMREEILANEQRLEALQRNIRNKEKQIPYRNDNQ